MMTILTEKYSFSHPTPFLGREHELADIQTRLNDPRCRLLTLTGLGGSGKTRLAIEVGRIVASQFQDGVFFVGLEQLTESDLLVHAIARALGLTFYGEDKPDSQLLNYLQDKSLLLLLDNFEHLLPGAALVSAILTHVPRVKLLVTSREALDLQEEWLFPVTGMSLPPSAYSTSLENYDAVQLFLYHARRIQPDFDLKHEHEAVAVICRMAAGLPLAIELAASWLRGLTTAQIAAAARNNLDILSTTTRNIEERHRSMRAVFDQSWTLLSENERRAFAGLSVFRGTFDDDAAEQVVGASLTLLAALVEKSLIIRESANRFRVHELLRQYAAEKLDERGETETMYARHAVYFAQALLGYEAALKQTRQPETMYAIESDFENIRFAWEWSVKNQQISQLHQMLNGLYLFGFLGNRHLEILNMFREIVTQPISDLPLKGRLLARRWGFLHWWYQTDYQETLTSLEESLAIATSEQNRFEIAFSRLMITYVLINTEHDVDALSHLETSLALFKELDEPFYIGWVLSRLAYVYFDLNDYDQAFGYAQQGLALAQIVRNRFALVVCHYFFGLASILRGDYIKGAYFANEALQNANELGQPCQLAHALSLFALCAFCQGDFASCQNYATRALTLVEDIVSLIFQPQSLSLLTLLACLRADYVEGVRLRELGIHHGTNVMDLQLRYWSLAMLSCGLGNREETRLYVAKTLRLTESVPQYALLSWISPAAVYALSNTDREHAVELLSWVESVPDTSADWVRQWAFFDRLQSQLQAKIGSDSYQTHWEQGKALTFDAANVYLRHEFVPADHTNTESVEHSVLTRREIEILRLIAAGLTNPQIADELVIGTATVKTHTLNIYRKLDAANRTQAIVRAQELSLLP
jgi:predicted ATPase/DNA-binding CsgD family transcriptional regulator